MPPTFEDLERERKRAKKRAQMLKVRPKSNKGKKYKRHRERGPTFTKKKFLKALKGTGGALHQVAKRFWRF